MEISQINNPQIIDSLIANAQSVNQQGATCETYYARLHGRRVFIKRLKEEYRLNPRYLSALEKEFNIGFKLEHKALPHYLLLEKDAIVMDYIDGVTLSQFITENPSYFSVDENVNRFMRQLLNCINYLHQNSVLHLDLKPQNIMLSHIDNDVRIVDLGFCYSDAYNDTTGYTNTFAAPELKEETGIKIGSYTDIFAIGKILEYLIRNGKNNRYIKIAKKCQDEDIHNRPNIETLISLFSSSNRRWIKSVILATSIVAISAIIGLIAYNQFELNRLINPNQLTDSNSASSSQVDTIVVLQKNDEPITIKPQNAKLKNAEHPSLEYKYPAPDYPFQSKHSNMEVKCDWYRELRPVYDNLLAHYLAVDSILWFNNAFNEYSHNLIKDENSSVYKKYNNIPIEDIYNDGMHVFTMISWMHQGLPIEISGHKRPPRPDLTQYANEQISLFENR